MEDLHLIPLYSDMIFESHESDDLPAWPREAFPTSDGERLSTIIKNVQNHYDNLRAAYEVYADRALEAPIEPNRIIPRESLHQKSIELSITSLEVPHRNGAEDDPGIAPTPQGQSYRPPQPPDLGLGPEIDLSSTLLPPQAAAVLMATRAMDQSTEDEEAVLERYWQALAVTLGSERVAAIRASRRRPVKSYLNNVDQKLYSDRADGDRRMSTVGPNGPTPVQTPVETPQGHGSLPVRSSADSPTDNFIAPPTPASAPHTPFTAPVAPMAADITCGGSSSGSVPRPPPVRTGSSASIGTTDPQRQVSGSPVSAGGMAPPPPMLSPAQTQNNQDAGNSAAGKETPAWMQAVPLDPRRRNRG